ncbi:radical SAM/SPASM domain-containing protein [Chlorobaculum sp. 24CR]|uniref:radical SAM/SPASM domain-containing protein n=1 Tax=Chlorobaculum sp. 24CR TaxID=2508878 RepID=UPI00100C1569|nr:radical SAM/SPASM domain-containing protein [Chlorobaculum sp. 24CR]RXK88468.1 radical SAM/SPASM domain-containing protein [Chlorobaculum sp. 24CR]
MIRLINEAVVKATKLISSDDKGAYLKAFIKGRFNYFVNLVLIKVVNRNNIKSVLIEINSACNRRCAWCPNSTFRRPNNGFLEESLFYDIVNQLVEMRFKGSIAFNLYNEPLLDKRLPDFIKYIREQLPSCYIYLNTNGDVLSLELWKLLRRNGLDYANISQYDGKLSKNIEGIMQSLDKREMKHFYAHVFDLLSIQNRAGLVTTNTQLPLKKVCTNPFFQLCIDYRGKVVLCCNDFFGKIEMGDVRTQSIKEIWESTPFVKYRKELRKGNRANLELCKICDI